MSCDMLRMIVNRCELWAHWGSSSQILMPLLDVAIGRYEPRIFDGALGLGSHISWWLGPPHIQSNNTDLTGTGLTCPGLSAASAIAANQCGNANPRAEQLPACSK